MPIHMQPLLVFLSWQRYGTGIFTRSSQFTQFTDELGIVIRLGLGLGSDWGQNRQVKVISLKDLLRYAYVK